MKKKILFTILLGVFVLTLSGCRDNIKFKDSYEALNGKENASGKVHRTITIDKNNPFKEVRADKIVELVNNKETFYVYFGDPLCPWCRSVLEKFIEVSNKHNIKTVYYVKIWDEEGNEILRDKITLNEDGTKETTVEGTEAYKKLLTIFDSVLSDYNATDSKGESVFLGEKRIFAPNFMYVKDGVAIKMVEGISSEQTDSRGELTE